jgi:hypothetical protein
MPLDKKGSIKTIDNTCYNCKEYFTEKNPCVASNYNWEQEHSIYMCKKCRQQFYDKKENNL